MYGPSKHTGGIQTYAGGVQTDVASKHTGVCPNMLGASQHGDVQTHGGIQT